MISILAAATPANNRASINIVKGGMPTVAKPAGVPCSQLQDETSPLCGPGTPATMGQQVNAGYPSWIIQPN